MKKFLNLFLIISILFSLGACSIPSGNTGSKNDDTTIENNEENNNDESTDDTNDENTSDEENNDDTTDDEDSGNDLQELLDNYTVYVTKTGSCYHRRNCSTIAKSKNLYSMTRKEAKAKGYTSCSKCKS